MYWELREIYKDFEEFKEKIHPYYGQGNFSKNCSLFKFIEEKEEVENKNGLHG